MIYLDNAATTFPKPECVYKALDKANRELAFNAGRGHYDGANNAHSLIEETRSFLLEKANANSLIFTPSATYAINQIVNGIPFESGDVVYCSAYDHNAIARTLHALSKSKQIQLKIIPLNEDLSIDLEKFEFECIVDKPKAIFCSHVSNVTGYILPIREIGKIAKLNDTLFIVDGAQAFGLVPVDCKEMKIDYYVFAGHKTLYGPFGIAGFFSNRNDLLLSLYGGTGTDSLNLDMPKNGSIRYEPSSPNVVAIAGLLESSKWVFDCDCLSHEVKLCNYAFKKLKDIEGVVICNNLDLPHTGIVSFNLDNLKSEELAEILSKDFDICVRGGYHCCPFIHDAIKSTNFSGTVRISFGIFNTTEDVDKLIESVEEISMEV